jgi:hypothetical protein
MRGLDPRIHDLERARQDVDGRDKPGHDEHDKKLKVRTTPPCPKIS